ncbi:MAG: hypothetical protein NC548_11025 [Lachnospiraceae bacterium]|nr:hypothetical protein [Lachnospiraceae bacterium]
MDRELLRLDAESIYKMTIVDYLISNKDRHGENWGVYYDSATCEILRCHPLFDHNNSFDDEYMQNPDSIYLFNGKSLRKSALNAIKHCDLHFTDTISRSDFITQRQYDSFMSRAEELGIQTIKDKSTPWDRYIHKYSINNYTVEKQRLYKLYNTTDWNVVLKHIEEDFL